MTNMSVLQLYYTKLSTPVLERLQLSLPVREPGHVHLQRLSVGDAELDSELAQRISEGLGGLDKIQ
jgi:hypothetical protein